jgi:hypothetical protein
MTGPLLGAMRSHGCGVLRAADPLTGAPTPVPDAQLAEVRLRALHPPKPPGANG